MEPRSSPNRPPHFSIPDTLPGDLLDRQLDVGAFGALIVAWSESSRYQLDGRLAKSRIRGLRGWTKARENALLEAGAIVDAGEYIVLIGYAAVNRSRAEIDALRQARAEAGARGGVATSATADRDPRGRFATARPARQPSKHLPGANSNTVIDSDHNQGISDVPEIDSLDGVIALITARWGWPTVTDRQRRLIAEMADRRDLGAAGYRRIGERLRAVEPSQVEDPIALLLVEDRSIKEKGQRAAAIQEAQSRAMKSGSPTPARARPMSIAEILRPP